MSGKLAHQHGCFNSPPPFTHPFEDIQRFKMWSFKRGSSSRTAFTSSEVHKEKPNATTGKKKYGHQSALPDFLYPLSFAGPLPPFWISPKRFFSHPWVLYSVGVIGVTIASLGWPLLHFVIGHWMNGITNLSKTTQEREDAGSDAAIWMLGPLLGAFFGNYLWFQCCKFSHNSTPSARFLDLQVDLS